jgi:AcrR family transcriptional regulator
MQILKNSVKDQILVSAVQEFKERGFTQASLRNIAQAANISVGNVYRYFEGKEQLFQAIILPRLKSFESIMKLEPNAYEQPQIAFNELANMFSSTLISLIEEDKDALYVTLNDPMTANLIQSHLKAFLTRLATQWLDYLEADINQTTMVIDMLAQGIFQGCLHAVKLANTQDSEHISEAIKMYFELHVYMIYAIKGDSL